MEIGTALTLTYRRHHSVEPRSQFLTTIGQVCMLLRRSCDYYEIYPELTVEGNIHYHIICSVKDNVKWMKKVLPTFKRNGFVKVKKIFDIDKWRKYCYKSVEDMLDILTIEDLPITRKNDTYFKKVKISKDDLGLDSNNILRYFAQ